MFELNVRMMESGEFEHSIQFNSNFISHLWPNGQITRNITFYKTHKITSRRLNLNTLKGVLHLWALFLKTLCIFSKNKATSDKVSYGSGQKCSKELENYSFTSVETIVVKLQWKMCKNQYFPCFEPWHCTCVLPKLPISIEECLHACKCIMHVDRKE